MRPSIQPLEEYVRSLLAALCNSGQATDETGEYSGGAETTRVGIGPARSRRRSTALAVSGRRVMEGIRPTGRGAIAWQACAIVNSRHRHSASESVCMRMRVHEAPVALAVKLKRKGAFDAQAFLDSAGIQSKIVEYRRADVIFTQGDPCEHVLYVQQGGVKLSVLSKGDREAVVAIVGAGEFFGEGCLAGQPNIGSATAATDCTILLVDKDQMVRLLHTQHTMSDRFIAHMLARNLRIEEDCDLIRHRLKTLIHLFHHLRFGALIDIFRAPDQSGHHADDDDGR